MKKIKIVKENEMQYAIYIDNDLYIRVGARCTAENIQKNLNFIYNT